MEIIGGKQVLTTIPEIVDPHHSCLVVIDMQNDFFAPGGLWHGTGLDLSMAEATIPKITRLIEGARRVSMPVVYVKMTNLPSIETLSPTRIRHMMFKTHLREDQIIARIGTWGSEILPQLAPQPGDLIVNKWRYSAFQGTCLDQVLRSKGIETVIMCGGTTSVCVESTARDAFQHDYYAVVATDCVSDVRADWHEASLLLMQPRIDQVPSEELLAIWAKE